MYLFKNSICFYCLIRVVLQKLVLELKILLYFPNKKRWKGISH